MNCLYAKFCRFLHFFSFLKTRIKQRSSLKAGQNEKCGFRFVLLSESYQPLRVFAFLRLKRKDPQCGNHRDKNHALYPCECALGTKEKKKNAVGRCPPKQSGGLSP